MKKIYYLSMACILLPSTAIYSMFKIDGPRTKIGLGYHPLNMQKTKAERIARAAVERLIAVEKQNKELKKDINYVEDLLIAHKDRSKQKLKAVRKLFDEKLDEWDQGFEQRAHHIDRLQEELKKEQQRTAIASQLRYKEAHEHNKESFALLQLNIKFQGLESQLRKTESLVRQSNGQINALKQEKFQLQQQIIQMQEQMRQLKAQLKQEDDQRGKAAAESMFS